MESERDDLKRETDRLEEILENERAKVQQLKKKLTEDFTFSLAPSQVSRSNYLSLAAQYQASVEAPPRSRATCSC